MARLNVNPNRMELIRLRERLVVAKRGHKLLKNKQDELMRRFVLLIRHNNRLRKEVESELAEAYRDFVLIGAVNSPEFLEEAVMFPEQNVTMRLSQYNIMSVDVPMMEFSTTSSKADGIYPYGFFGTSDELDRALFKISILLPRLLELGEVEKTSNLLADEIEKTRRRVNALEHMTIPQLNETIRYIQIKLDENERANVVRIMKVKSMIEAEEERARLRREALS